LGLLQLQRIDQVYGRVEAYSFGMTGNARYSQCSR